MILINILSYIQNENNVNKRMINDWILKLILPLANNIQIFLDELSKLYAFINFFLLFKIETFLT